MSEMKKDAATCGWRRLVAFLGVIDNSFNLQLKKFLFGKIIHLRRSIKIGRKKC